MQTDLDKTDLAILSWLQRDSSASVAEIAESVGLSQSPCWRRIQRLEQTGIISERVALLGPSVSGKSTFLTAVGMINLPTTSQVRIGGRDSATGTLRPPGTLYRHLLNTPKL